MNYYLDIGNTHTRVATWEQDEIKIIAHFKTTELSQYLDKTKYNRCDKLWISSVVKETAQIVAQYLDKSQFHFINYKDLVDVDFSLVANPQSIGADRIANIAAACSFGIYPVAIFDCGTAITTEVINERKQFIGGAIMPGRQLLRNSLYNHTSLLPLLNVAEDGDYNNEIGLNTSNSIRFGTNMQSFGGIKEIINQLRVQIPTLDIIITGGDKMFYDKLSTIHHLPNNFTLYGVKWIADNNRN